MPGSFFKRDRHSGFCTYREHGTLVGLTRYHTFFASFFCFRCFAELAFSILCRSRTGTRLEVGSGLNQHYTPRHRSGSGSLPGFFIVAIGDYRTVIPTRDFCEIRGYWMPRLRLLSRRYAVSEARYFESESSQQN